MLDEPTSGLDPLVQQEFFTIIREAKAEGRTVFMSSHILSEVEKTCDRVAIIRDGRLVRVDRVEALRDMAHHQVELRFTGPVPASEFEALPGVSNVVADDHVLRMRVSGRITPVVRAAARYELADFVSREPSLEETFLAEYGPHGCGGRRRDDSRNGQPSTVSPMSRIFGLGSVFAKTVRDSRRSTLIAGVAIGLLLIAVSAGIISQFSTAEAREEIRNIVDAVPPVMQGLAGPPVNVETLGGYIQYKYGGFLPAGHRAVVDPRPLRHAGRREPAREPRLPASPSRSAAAAVAWEKVLAHVVMLTVAMTLIGAATALAGSLRHPAGRRDHGRSRHSASPPGSGSWRSRPGRWPSCWRRSSGADRPRGSRAR